MAVAIIWTFRILTSLRTAVSSVKHNGRLTLDRWATIHSPLSLGITLILADSPPHNLCLMPTLSANTGIVCPLCSEVEIKGVEVLNEHVACLFTSHQRALITIYLFINYNPNHNQVS